MHGCGHELTSSTKPQKALHEVKKARHKKITDYVIHLDNFLKNVSQEATEMRPELARGGYKSSVHPDGGGTAMEQAGM